MKTFFVGEIGEKWLETKTPLQIKVHLCHIAAHLLLSHPQRSPHLRNHPKWNYACDLEANHLLRTLNLRAFYTLKPFKKKWVGLSAEEIFIRLTTKEEKQERFNDDHQFWRDLTKADTQKIITQSVASKVMTSEQIRALITQTFGNRLPFTKLMTAGYEAGDTVEVISVPVTSSLWFKVKNVLDAVLIKRRGFSRPEYDFLLMWQRRYAEVMLPLYPRQIIVTVDTSGSISTKGLRACAAIANFVVTSVLAAYPSAEVYVALADADLQRWWSSTTATEPLIDFLREMKGRGGTQLFKATQKLIDQENLSPDAVIVISDFDTTDSDKDLKPDAPIIGIIVNENRNPVSVLEEKQKDQKYKNVRFAASLTLDEVIVSA